MVAVHMLSWMDALLQMESNSFDLYTIAFGIRNVPDVQLALSEAFRVLKPGGRLMVLEFRCASLHAIASTPRLAILLIFLLL